MSVRKIYSKDMKARLEKWQFDSFERLSFTKADLESILEDYYISGFGFWYFDADPEDKFSYEEYEMFRYYLYLKEGNVEPNSAFNFNGKAYYQSLVEFGWINHDDGSLAKYTEKELEEAFNKVCKAYDDFEESRLNNMNWCDPCDYGINGLNLSDINEWGIKILNRLIDYANKEDDGLKDIRFTKFNMRIPQIMKPSINDDTQISLYCFFRDTEFKCDYPFTFTKKGYYFDWDAMDLVYDEVKVKEMWGMKWPNLFLEGENNE
jgi:hypothetical protein